MSKASSVRAFLGSVEGLCLIESVLRKALKPFKDVSPTDPDSFGAFCDLTRLYLVVQRACNEALTTDLRAQRDFEELKKQIEAGMTPAEVEQTLEYHFARKGWGSLAFVRTSLFTYLTESGLKAEQAQEIVDATVPKGDERSRTLPIQHKIRKSYDRMEAAMAEGAADLHEALAHSEEPDSSTDQETTTVPGPDHSDDTDDTEKH